MALADRLIGYDDAGNLVQGKILLHGFAALMGEVVAGRLTAAQALTNLNGILANRNQPPLTAGEQAEAQTLLTSITSIGGANAIRDKLVRWLVIENVVVLGELRAPDYNTPTKIKTALGF